MLWFYHRSNNGSGFYETFSLGKCLNLEWKTTHTMCKKKQLYPARVKTNSDISWCTNNLIVNKHKIDCKAEAMRCYNRLYQASFSSHTNQLGICKHPLKHTGFPHPVSFLKIGNINIHVCHWHWAFAWWVLCGVRLRTWYGGIQHSIWDFFSVGLID